MRRAVRGRTPIRGLTIAVLVAALVAAATPAAAYHAERRNELQRLIDSKSDQLAALNGREDDTLAKLNASTARQAELEARLAAVEAELAAARTLLRKIENRLDRVTIALRTSEVNIERTQANLDERTTILNDRIAEIFTSAAETYTAVFTYAESFDDVVVGTEYLDRVVAYDRVLLDEIEVIKGTLERQRAKIEAKREGLRADRQAARATAEDIAAKRAERLGAVHAIAREVSYQGFLLSEIRSKKAKAREVLREYQRESEDIERFLRGVQGGNRVIAGRGGWLRYPVSGQITSDYGWRSDPISGQRSFHTGIDIGAPQGTTVGAARGGRVVDVGYRGPYGLVVLIDHGEGIATLYAHLSATYVSNGEHVSTLESIAAVGSTGYSTGPHLHFEVRSNGYHQNPNSWF